MAPKTRKSLSPWYTCEVCNVVLTQKDLPLHQDKSCPPPVEDWSHGFIRDKVLHSSLELFTATDSLKYLPKSEYDHLVFLSISAMQLCAMAVGEPVVITVRNKSAVKAVWPTAERSLVSVQMTREALDLEWGSCEGLVTVGCLTRPVWPAHEISVGVTSSVDVPANISSLLHRKYKGKLLCAGNCVCIPYYGRTLCFKVERMAALDATNRVNALSKHLSDISLTETVAEQCSTTLLRNSGGVEAIGLESGLGDTIVSERSPFCKIVECTKWNVVNAGKVDDKESRSRLCDVGGLESVITQVKELMDLALGTRKDKASLQGLKLTRGVLLYGPSGAGKTLVASALAADSGAFTLRIDGPEIFSKFFGETEARLKQCFVEARSKSPCVILLDEVDSLCSRHGERGGTDQERRVVATLLTLMDSLHVHQTDVMVLATSSKPDSVDPALRRPGRLDREVEVGVPSPDSRLDILCKLLAGVPHNVTQEQLVNISRAAHGFVGADLASLVSRGAMRAVKRITEVTITNEDLLWAFTQVKPSAMREVLVEVPNVRWSDIGGQHELKLKLRQAVEWPLKHPDSFTRLGITAPRGVLMYGPPGCSKTMIAKALATESRLNFLSIKGPELFSKWVGESERAVREVFRRARQVAPSIVFFDELDAIGGERSSSQGGGSNVQERVLAQLLTELDGVEPLGNVTVVGATNRPDRIDKALLRPGRLDRVIYVPLPDTSTRHEIFTLQLKKTPVTNDVNIEELVQRTEGYSGAEVLAVCHEAALKALEEDLMIRQVSRSHFLTALTLVTPRTPASLLRLYQDYLNS